MRIAVGCPVSNREWILPRWFTHVETAFENVGVEPEYVMVVGTSADATGGLVSDYLADKNAVIVESVERPETGEKRDWESDRYYQMVVLRNRLLEAVRELSPDFFLSVDSDILLHPKLMPNLLETIQDYDAVGGKVYLQPPPQLTCNYGSAFNRSNGLIRSNPTGVLKVPIIMALKLMRPTAYGVDYEHHFKGEDIGWSLACQRAGLSFAFDARLISKHVMHADLLDVTDLRVGF